MCPWWQILGLNPNWERLRQDQPAHDTNDYDVAQRVGFRVDQHPEPRWHVERSCWQISRTDIQAARQKVIADMEALELMDRIESRDIELAHSDRSKTAIEPYWRINGS